jgi:hypothetical protein
MDLGHPGQGSTQANILNNQTVPIQSRLPGTIKRQMSFAFRQFQFRIASGIELSSYFNSLHLVCELIREPVGLDHNACEGCCWSLARKARTHRWGRAKTIKARRRQIKRRIALCRPPSAQALRQCRASPAGDPYPAQHSETHQFPALRPWPFAAARANLGERGRELPPHRQRRV